MKIFSLDSPFMQSLSRMADLLWLNLLAAICCVPIITIGASMTALNYMALKMARNEECYITRGFFKSFKENFKQATAIWLMILLVAGVIFGDFVIMNNVGASFNKAVRILVTIVGVIVVFTVTYVFPLLAKFDNTVFRTIKNAFVVSVLQFPKTILMIIVNLVPVVVLMVSIKWSLLAMLFGLSVPAYVNAMLYNKFFKKLEAQIEEANGGSVPAEDPDAEAEKIFHDEIDESLSGGEN